MEEGNSTPVGMPSQDEKTQGMLVWLLSIFIGIISPVIFMLIGKEKRFVYANAMQCLTVSLFVLVISIVTCGFGAVLFVVTGIVGTIKANNGEVWEPPVTGPLAKKWFNV